MIDFKVVAHEFVDAMEIVESTEEIADRLLECGLTEKEVSDEFGYEHELRFHCDKIVYTEDGMDYDVKETMAKYHSYEFAERFSDSQDYDVLIVKCDDEGGVLHDCITIRNTTNGRKAL